MKSNCSKQITLKWNKGNQRTRHMVQIAEGKDSVKTLRLVMILTNTKEKAYNEAKILKSKRKWECNS